jgi:hypothetical protein
VWIAWKDRDSDIDVPWKHHANQIWEIREERPTSFSSQVPDRSEARTLEPVVVR